MYKSIPAQTVSFLPPQDSGWRSVVFVFFLVLPIFYAVLSIWLGQNASWDLLNYHLYNAHAFLNDRFARDLMPSQLQYFFNPLLDVPFYWLATSLPPHVAYSILAAVQGLNGIPLFMICYAALQSSAPRSRTLLSLILTVLGLSGAMAMSEIGMVYYDNVLSLAVLLSLVMILRLQEKTTPLALFLCGLPLGLATGLKLPAAIFCVGGCGAFFLTQQDFKIQFKTAFIFGLGILAGMAVTYGWWGWIMWSRFGNPFFPHFNMLFRSSLMPDMTAVVDLRFFPDTVVELLFYPFIFAFDPLRTEDQVYTDFRMFIFYSLLLLVIGCGLWRHYIKKQAFLPPSTFTVRYLVGFAAVSYVAWLFYFCVYRYLLAVELLLPLLIVLMASVLPLKINMRHIFTTACLVFIALTTRPADWGRLPQWSPQLFASETNLSADETGLILMAGESAYSHLIPTLPEGLNFIRIESRFYKPLEMKQPFNDMVRREIEKNKETVRLLIPAQDYGSKSTREALMFFGFELSNHKCQKITDLVYQPNIYALCDVKSIKPRS